MSSQIDVIFEKIFGQTFSKKGIAFEQLSAIVCHLIYGGEVKHDDKLRGQFSKTLYQLDVHDLANNVSLMGEAKDYTERNSKVGRGDIQKLGGALPDLKEIDEGIFFSATGFTKPTKKYAEEAKNIIGKPITLYNLQPSTELDETGFIKKIVITIHFFIPQLDEAKWIPHLSDKGQVALKVLHKENKHSEHQVNVRCFYDDKGCEVISIKYLTEHGYGDINQDNGKTHACFWLKNKYVKINEILVEILGLEYEIKYIHEISTIRITDDSENRLALLNKDGKAIKIITDNKLREYEFDESGNLKRIIK